MIEHKSVSVQVDSDYTALLLPTGVYEIKKMEPRSKIRTIIIICLFLAIAGIIGFGYFCQDQIYRCMDQLNDNQQEIACDNLFSNDIQKMEVQEEIEIGVPVQEPKPMPQKHKKLLKNLLINTPPPPTNLVPETEKLQIDSTSILTNEFDLFSCDGLGVDESFRSEGKLTLTIENFSNSTDTIFSSPVYIRNLPWRMMVVPKASNKQCDNGLAIYLQCNYDTDSQNWSCQATAQISLVNYKTLPFTRHINHLYYFKENDWGYSNFIEYDTVIDPNEGYIQNDTIVFEAYVKAQVPSGIFWDSKKFTGYIGLKNQGATCYMNSLLQTLYFTSSLRKAVYKIPTEADDTRTSVALALQRVFYDLQFSNESVGTKKLTKSFGWETNDSFLQHDIQEFLRVLLDKLETEMKGTNIEYVIPSLFQGKMVSYIKCINIEYESKRIETFYDIQLNIKGKKSIDDSFREYVKPETLEDPYDAGSHGFQKAEKGVKFQSFPPVLYLHLMRFQYDPVTMNSVKFNDRFEFYDEINLDPYLSEVELTPATYKLYAVLVHSGDNQGGHYVVYINPKGNGQWCKFDDQIVSNCTESDAIEANYGSNDSSSNNSSAYMLVYIRISVISRILEEINYDNIPTELIDKLREERRLQTYRRVDHSGSTSVINIHIILEEFFETHEYSDLYEPRDVSPIIFKLKKHDTIGDFFELLVGAFKVHASRLRIWKLGSLSNLIRPVYFDCDFERTIEKTIGKNQLGWEIYLEKCLPDKPGPLQPFVKHEHILIFFKFYDSVTHKLNYLGSRQYSIKTKIIDALPAIRTRDIPEVTRLMVYEEVDLNAIQPIPNLEETIEDSLFVNGKGDVSGTILILQDRYPDFNQLLVTCEEYYRFLLQQIEVIFESKLNPKKSFYLRLSKKSNYTEFSAHVARKLGTDPLRIQFFKRHRDEPHDPIKSTYFGSLKDLLAFNRPKDYRLYYQKISMSIKELENKRQFRCLWLSSNLKDEKELILYPDINETVRALLNEAATVIEFSENSSRRLRLIEINEHKIVTMVTEDMLVGSLHNISENKITQYTKRYYRVEEIQRDELEITENDFLITVIHFNRITNFSFGHPFLLKITHNETFSSIKMRIKKRLSVLDKDWEKYKFIIESMVKTEIIVNDGYVIDVEQFKMPADLIEDVNVPLPYIGLDHLNVNKSLKRTRNSNTEKSIKIYN